MELIIESKLNDKALATADCIGDIRDDEIVVFVSHAEQDVPLGANFGGIELISCTQQFNYLLDDGIPVGWKTICKFRIPYNMREEFDRLPSRGNWKYDRDTQIVLDHYRWRENRLNQLLEKE